MKRKKYLTEKRRKILIKTFKEVLKRIEEDQVPYNNYFICNTVKRIFGTVIKGDKQHTKELDYVLEYIHTHPPKDYRTIIESDDFYHGNAFWHGYVKEERIEYLKDILRKIS